MLAQEYRSAEVDTEGVTDSLGRFGGDVLAPTADTGVVSEDVEAVLVGEDTVDDFLNAPFLGHVEEDSFRPLQYLAGDAA